MGKKQNKALHPTDAHRKAERQKEIKRNKFQKAQVRTGTQPCAQAPDAGWRGRAAAREQYAYIPCCCCLSIGARERVHARSRAPAHTPAQRCCTRPPARAPALTRTDISACPLARTHARPLARTHACTPRVLTHARTQDRARARAGWPGTGYAVPIP